MRLVSDLETNGLLDTVTVIHCLVSIDPDTGDVYAYHNDPSITPRTGSIEEGLAQLQALGPEDTVYFHNGIRYDTKVIRKLHPGHNPRYKLRDTLVLSRMIWPEIKLSDATRVKRKTLPPKLRGRYSLEAWGHRLGNYKGDYKGGWEVFTQEMLDYCIQDVKVTVSLLAKCDEKGYPEEAIDLEHRVTFILDLQEEAGFRFNVEKAVLLYAELVSKRDAAAKALASYFPDWEIVSTFIPKRNNKTKGYVEGVPVKRVKVVQFNPGSRDHIAERLKVQYGWEPTEFTPSGKPKVDETTMKDLAYPCAPALMEYLLMEKRIGQVAEGKEAWLKKVKADGRIHGSVNPQGTVTIRMTHMWPNVSQVPKVGSPYGAECRALFEAGPGKKLVGCDAAGIQLRGLGHFMAKFDGGEFANTVIEGKEDDGTDIHSVNAVALGLDPKVVTTVNGQTAKGRDRAKRFIYSYVLGAGDAKVAQLTGKPGKATKAAFLRRFPALKKLKDNIEKAIKRQGFIRSLDRRPMAVRSLHQSLAVVLQGFEAVIMKTALVLLYDDLTAAGLVHGREYAFVANIHDEFQIEVDEDKAEFVGKKAAEAIKKAGEKFNVRCPLAGNYKIGDNWRETH